MTQLLEEHHLAAWTPLAAQRHLFAEELAEYLAGMGDSRVYMLHGSQVNDLPAFCDQLERAIGLERIHRRIDGPDGIVGALRRRLGDPAERPIRQRFYIWRDAHIMLRADPVLFGRLADALMGVAAESEFASEDLLLIQRVVFVGGPALDLYAEDPRGQFRSWWSEKGETPLWHVVSGQDFPHVLSYRIGDEVELPPVQVRDRRALKRA